MASERKPDLRELTKELRDLTWAEVKAMTIQLGMQGSDLQKIEKSYNDDSERFIRFGEIRKSRTPRKPVSYPSN